MQQEIEIEFKNILEKPEFERLCSIFHVTDDCFKQQTNYYFDTDDDDIKANQSALRIRLKTGHYQLTIKQPHTEGLLETHQTLDEAEVKKMIETGKMPSGAVQTLLIKANIPTDRLRYLGSLTTDRAQFPYKDGELFLDHSTYLNHDDYELEFEVRDKESGSKMFDHLLTAYDITKRETRNKIMRFLNRMTEVNHDN